MRLVYEDSMKHRFMLFLPNHQLMSVIGSVCEHLDCQVTLRRYIDEKDCQTAIWRQLRPGEDWLQVFESETFREIHITRDVCPQSGRDPTFQERATEQAVIFSGGGQSEEVLARWIVLMPAPQGSAQPVFGRLQEELGALTRIGMVAGRHTYRDAWYAQDGEWSFVAGLYEGAVDYSPVD